jgi:hypothetical protein
MNELLKIIKSVEPKELNKKLKKDHSQINLKSMYKGKLFTPLNYACSLGRKDAVKILLKYGAEINTSTKGHGETPINVAAANGHYELIQYLYKKGANIHSGGTGPTHWAFYGKKNDFENTLKVIQNIRKNDEIFNKKTKFIKAKNGSHYSSIYTSEESEYIYMYVQSTINISRLKSTINQSLKKILKYSNVLKIEIQSDQIIKYRFLSDSNTKEIEISVGFKVSKRCKTDEKEIKFKKIKNTKYLSCIYKGEVINKDINEIWGHLHDHTIKHNTKVVENQCIEKYFWVAPKCNENRVEMQFILK